MPAISILRDPEAMHDAVERSASIREALELLGLRAAGGNYRAFHEACDRLGIAAPVGARTPPPGRRFEAVPDSEVFCENSRFLNRGAIKRRLAARGVPQECAMCGQGEEWNELPLVPHLDHINGVYNDNRLENLRLLCPNCHSQTETYAGRSSRPVLMRVPCRHCAKPNRATAKRCSACCRWFTRHPGRFKIIWPDDAELARMVAAGTFVAVGAALGVSDSAVRKRLKSAHSREPATGLEPVACPIQGDRSA